MKPTLAGQLVWPALVVLVATAVFQAPIFVLVGGGRAPRVQSARDRRSWNVVGSRPAARGSSERR
jgi:hypothetical protein